MWLKTALFHGVNIACYSKLLIVERPADAVAKLLALANP